MSLYTSLLGAVVNLALNLVMIPDWGLGWGAMGASVATFISYFLVYVIRAATMKRFLRFEMCHFKFIVNTIILSAIVVVMTMYGAVIWGIVGASALLLISMIFNSRDVIRALKQVLSSMRNRGAGTL